MILQAWGPAAALVVASVVIGHALALLGGRCRAAGPAVGLGLLIVLAGVGVQLPGRATTAAGLLALCVTAAVAVIVIHRRRLRPGAAPRRPHAALVASLSVVLLSAISAAVPFLANGRVGLLGVSLDNDTAAHLVWAQALSTPATGARYGVNQGYPLGPHSLVAALSRGFGARTDLALTALLIAVVLVTALVASAALRGEAPWKRVLTGVLTALLYLVAAYYAEGAFKEPLMGLLLLAMVLQFEELRGDWAAPAGHARWRGLVPMAVIWAAAVWVYSYTAAAWFAGTLAIWFGAELARRPRALRRWRQSLRAALIPGAVAIALTALLLIGTAPRILTYIQSLGVSPAGTGAISTANLGNLAHALPAWEGLGIWEQSDFRFTPTGGVTGLLDAVALAVLLFGVAWSVCRRELLLPAAVAACALIFWHSEHTQSPYVTAKALVIAGPVIAVTGLRGLLTTPGRPWPRWVTVPRLVVACLFVVLAAASSLKALTSEPVWAPESVRELTAFDARTAGQKVLFLGDSDFAPWLFHDSDMSAISGNTVSLAQAAARPAKPWKYGTALDFDSIDPSVINRFAWVVTTTSGYASQAPAGFRLARRLAMYELWQRVGTVAPRQVIEPVGAPGGLLDCHSGPARALSRRPGVAAVMAVPVIAGLTAEAVGASERVTVPLPGGAWDLSMQYTSPVDLELSAPGWKWHVPAYVDRPGPLFNVGQIRVTGAPVTFTVHAIKPSFLMGSNVIAIPIALVATRPGMTRTVVPLRRACGHYVDWYRLSAR